MINYDNSGRMTYCPELHDRQGQPWTVEETEYLIEWYKKIGLEEMSLALGRSETSVAARVNALKTKGLMTEGSMRTFRLLKYEGQDNLIWRVYG